MDTAQLDAQTPATPVFPLFDNFFRNGFHAPVFYASTTHLGIARSHKHRVATMGAQA
jgi:hypothetical protein